MVNAETKMIRDLKDAIKLVEKLDLLMRKALGDSNHKNQKKAA